MSRIRGAVWLLALTLLFVGACSVRHIGFMHVRHRVNYSLEAQELERAQFYISTRILAKDISDSAVRDEAAGVIIVPEGTPGMVLEVGPRWLRVSFDKEGSGVMFLSDPERGDDAYWLATEVEGQPGLHKVKDLPEKILLNGGTAYKLIYGANARLLINEKDLGKLIEQRRHLKGRVKDSQ